MRKMCHIYKKNDGNTNVTNKEPQGTKLCPDL